MSHGRGRRSTHASAGTTRADPAAPSAHARRRQGTPGGAVGRGARVVLLPLLRRLLLRLPLARVAVLLVALLALARLVEHGRVNEGERVLPRGALGNLTGERGGGLGGGRASGVCGGGVGVGVVALVLLLVMMMV